MSIKLTSLKREEIRKVIPVKYANGQTGEIKVFNPNEELTQQIANILIDKKYIDTEKNTIEIGAMDTLTLFLSKLTDIEIPEDKDAINEILNDQSPYLKLAILEVGEIILEISIFAIRTLKLTKATNDMIKEEVGSLDDKNKEIVKEDKNKKDITPRPKAKKNSKLKVEKIEMDSNVIELEENKAD